MREQCPDWMVFIWKGLNVIDKKTAKCVHLQRQCPVPLGCLYTHLPRFIINNQSICVIHDIQD